MQKLRVVVPVFDDWDSFRNLMRDMDLLAADLPITVSVSAINDGSITFSDADINGIAPLEHLAQIEIIHLYSNLGHQRAIAIGLCVAVEDDDCDSILVMDADGEDSPLAIKEMLQSAGQSENFCVVARRGRRRENLTFKLSYLLYKTLFRLLTGHQIAFGNFCLISRNNARRLVTIPDLWRNLPAAILRSRVPLKSVLIDRAQRYAGKSKMDLTSLILHGLSGISVYAETAMVRILVFALSLFALCGLSIGFVLSLRLFFPRYATPGWATTVSFGLAIILIQILSFTLSFILMLLNSRVQRLIVPIADYKCYIEKRQVVLTK